MAVEINLRDASAQHLRSAQARAQWTADVRWLQATAGDLRKHGREEKCIGVAEECECNRAVRAEFTFQVLRCGPTGESSAQDDDLFHPHFGRRWWNLLRPQPASRSVA